MRAPGQWGRPGGWRNVTPAPRRGPHREHPGSGNPYFTTDTAGSLRAVEIKADIILKGTRVDGIYSADPEKDPTATKYGRISFAECISKNLKVMDMTAFTLCMENNLPIVVFDMNKTGNLMSVVIGEKTGTLVS